MAELTESIIEQAAVAGLQAIGYTVTSSAACADIVEQAIAKLNAHLLKTGTDLVAASIFRPPHPTVGSSRVDLQACKLEYSIVSPK